MTLDSIRMMDEIPPGSGDEDAGFGGLDTTRGGLPLRRLAVNGRITGLLYRLTVAQTFVNGYAEPLEATYIFPLPARAGVTRFHLRVGARVIEGVLKERGEARAEYDRAIQQGHRAAIAEEERPEVFTLRVGNLPPGADVTVELELAGPLAVADGEATFRFPLVVAPRYIPGGPLPGPSVGLGTARDTDAVPDASRITPPVLLPGQPNPIHLTFRLELDPAGLPFGAVHASLHALQWGQTPEGLPVIELTPGAERLDRDILLRFRVGEDTIRSGLSVYHDPDGEIIGLLTVAPPATLPATFRPRDVVVLLDRSGSMGGWKMAAARRAAGRILDTLTERDRFGVILFDDEVEEPTPSAGRLVPATDRARFRAVEFLARVEARGGTEIAPALTRALAYFPQLPDPAREQILLFVTDGQVGDEEALLQQVQSAAQGCRIFTVGIDQAVNAALLERLAGYGGGHCALVESEDRLDAVLRAVHRWLGAPLLTDICLEPALDDLAPDTADLFPGVPLRLGGRFGGAVPAQVTVTGRAADGQPFRQTLTPVATVDAAVRTLWARMRVLDLEHQFVAAPYRDPDLAEAITAFSLRYGVLCRFTAFVAVDRSEGVNPGGEVRSVVQAVEWPAGWAEPGAAPRRAQESADLEEYLDIPAFLRRQALDGSGWSRSVTPAPPPAAPPGPVEPWSDRLLRLLNMPAPDPADLIFEMRRWLAKVEALGDRATALVTEGQDIIALLESDRLEEGRKRLADWLRRVREWLKQPAARKRRGFWWR